MVFDLAEFDDVLREEVLEPLDHQHINHAIPEFRYGGQIPTAEALAAYLWGRIVRRIPAGIELISVRVQEGPDLFAEYCADE
jgi:6-pyruvoyltetrahydropterin/6-carboxytetrahydropterin synthase